MWLEGRILLLDDNELRRRWLQRILEGAGHVVFCVGDGQAGLSLFDAVSPDVVITDLVMPRARQRAAATGAEGLRRSSRWNGARRGVKIMAIAGVVQRPDWDMLAVAKPLGAARTMKKPIGSEEPFV